ncbi:hypothetical protein [Candidatus Uabimicrobium sp. HlEnr_7]|uniref:hypothetical protein n=1 Tax=Candidatus Uabimicrobium helgolandensis TaxID=3095367 RepID=UPI003556672B
MIIAMLFSKLEWFSLIVFPPLILILLSYLHEKDFFADVMAKKEIKKKLKKKKRKK